MPKRRARRERARKNPLLWPILSYIENRRERSRLEGELAAARRGEKARSIRRGMTVEVFCPECWASSVVEAGEGADVQHAKKNCRGIPMIKAIYKDQAKHERDTLRAKIRERRERGLRGP